MSAQPRALRAWPFRVAARRMLRQSRLLFLVLAVAILASTAVSSIGLLVSATEASAIRTSLRQLPGSQTGMSVEVLQPTVSLAESSKHVDAAIGNVLGSTASATRTVRAYTDPYPVKTPGSATSVGYFGALDGVAGRVRMTAGKLPSAESKTATTADIAVPAEAAKALGLTVGTQLRYSNLTLTIVGIYAPKDAGSAYWSQDPLKAAGNSAGYLSPSGDQLAPVDAFGPMLVGSGALDSLGIRASRVEYDYVPSFASVDASQLEPLIQRITNADSDVPADVGAIAQQVSYQGDASVPISQNASALVVTRSSVVVVTLLLLVLSIAALAQAARLFNAARAGDRELMRARGASRAQLLSIAFLEAGVVGIITAGVSAPLSRLVYFIVAAQPAMRAASVPSDSGLPMSVWLTSIGLGTLFVVVLILSLLGPSGSFVATEQTRSRGRRVTGLLRSGLDLGVVVVAGVAFWQLSIYRSPVGASSSLSVDPVLVAAPALVLLAASLLAARVFPLVARLVDWWGSKSQGVLLRLASWEIGRRSQRATAVVLLLTLALAVGTFSQTFLSTWRQSQVDQADYAVGPPVRVPAIAEDGGAQQSLLEDGATGAPQPVIRRVADAAQDGPNDDDTNAVVLGLTAGARQLLDHGQNAKDGGALVARTLKATTAPAYGIRLPGAPAGIAATLKVGDTATALPGVAADVRAVVQDGAGLLTTVDLGDVQVDGSQQSVSALFPTLPKGVTRALPLTLVGLQANIFPDNPAVYQSNDSIQTRLLVGHLETLTGSQDSPTAHRVTATLPRAWNVSQSADSPARAITVAGWQLALDITVPRDVKTDPGIYAEFGWKSAPQIPAVMSSALAKTLDVKSGAFLVLAFANSSAEIVVAGISKLIPAAVDTALLTPSAAAGADAASPGAVVVDQTSLERALIEGGESGSMVDEWWVDVPAGTGAAYLQKHASSDSEPRSAEVLALGMQQDPLRVATQASLWLAIVAAALLAAIGFAVHSASTLAARRIELAQLRAIGLTRRRLVSLIASESLVLCAIGVVFGLLVGVLLGLLASPLIALSPSGLPAVPGVRVIIPWLQVGGLVVVVVAVLVAVVIAVSQAQRSSNPANILREADNG